MNFPKLLPILLIRTFIFFLNTNNSNANSAKETWKVFSDENAKEFNHLAVDEYGRWVYIGGVNHIYQLSTDLELQVDYTISELSPSDCTAPNCLHKLKRNTTTFNDNQVLILDDQNQQLISCGTFFRGICHAHNASNISKIWTPWFEPIIESKPSMPIVAFIAPSLPENSSTPLRTLYVGFTPDREEWSIQTITIRNQERKNFSSVPTQNTASHFTTSECPSGVQDGLIYGFSSENIGYFIAANADVHITRYAYLIVTDSHKNNSCKQIPIICSPGNRKRLLMPIKNAYIQKRNPDSGSKTDAHEMEEKIMFTLQERRPGYPAVVVCRYQMNELHSLFQKNETLVGHLVYSHSPNNEFVTAMVVTSVNNYTILFLGTADGRLQKISIEGVNSPDRRTASKYADITIDAESRVHSDMLFDSTMNFLYVMTKNKLTKVKIHNCNEYNTSHVCLETKDPYCGWCFPSNRCCLKSECDGEQNDIDWVSFDIYKYIDFSSSPAANISRTAESNVTIKLLTPHPFINHTTICLFEFDNFSINITTMCNGNSINCVTPAPNLLPTPINHHSMEAELLVQTNHFPVFQKLHLIFYDCSTYESCLSCITSPYPCQWYVNEFRCTDNAIWKEDDIVIGMDFSSTDFPLRNSKSLYYDENKFPRNSTFCPQFETKHKSDIYIPAHAHTGKVEQIQVHYKIPLNLHDDRFTCKFTSDSNKGEIQFRHSQISRFPGNGLKEGYITCSDVIFAYAEPKPFITVELSILWNGSIALDNTYNTHIIVYKCAQMRDQCTECLNKKYSCTWDSETRECKYYSSR